MSMNLAQRILILSMLGVIAAGCSSVTPSSGGVESVSPRQVGLIRDHEILVDEVVRVYDQYVPAAHWEDASPSPVVVLLHGQRSSRSDLERGPYSAWQEIADANNILLIIPQGVDGANGHAGWNDCRSDVVGNPDSDDVAFITRALDQVSETFQVDDERIFAVGTSNGGHMAIRLAHESPTRFAGTAVIAAGMPANNGCANAPTPISTAFMWGTEDPLAPYEGGPMAGRRGDILSADASIQYWIKRNGTTTSPETTKYSDLDPADNSTVERMFFKSEEDQAHVALFTVSGGGHTEPSVEHQYRRLVKRVLGEQNHDIEMADVLWEFFSEG